jgi:hypothetical protein
LAKVRDCLYGILEDGEVTQADRDQLYQCLADFAADPIRGPVIDGIFDDQAEIVFMAREFLFTGILQFGTRKKAEGAVRERGGRISPTSRPTRSLGYLIVGDFGNENWAHSRFGLKIHHALALKAKRVAEHLSDTPIIVRERLFVKAVLAMAHGEMP